VNNSHRMSVGQTLEFQATVVAGQVNNVPASSRWQNTIISYVSVDLGYFDCDMPHFYVQTSLASPPVVVPSSGRNRMGYCQWYDIQRYFGGKLLSPLASVTSVTMPFCPSFLRHVRSSRPTVADNMLSMDSRSEISLIISVQSAKKPNDLPRLVRDHRTTCRNSLLCSLPLK